MTKYDFLKIVKNLRFPLVLAGVLIASIMVASSVFGADLETVEVNYDGVNYEITARNADLETVLDNLGFKVSEGETLSCDENTFLSKIDAVSVLEARNDTDEVGGEEYNFGKSEYATKEIEDQIILPNTGVHSSSTSETTITAEEIVETVTITEHWPIDYQTKKEPDDSMYQGETKTIQVGKKGVREVVYKVIKVNGKTKSKEVQSNVVIENPVTKIVRYGTKKSTSTEKGITVAYKKVLRNFTATAYSAQESGNKWGYATASGLRAQPGIIAVDPNVIPLGTKVYVEGCNGAYDYGFAIAGDTGGAIKGNIIDLYIESVAECNRWGRRKVNIYILEDQSVNIFNKR